MLPGYYSPYWWEVEEEEEEKDGCTNEEVQEAVEYSLFVDSLPIQRYDLTAAPVSAD